MRPCRRLILHVYRSLLPLSPLSYCTDVVRTAFGSDNYFPLWLDFLMLSAFTALLVGAALFFHRRSREKAL